MTDEEKAELKAGVTFTVKPDEDDKRFSIVKFRRPASPNEPVRDYTGQQAATKFLKMCAACLHGATGETVERDGRIFLVVDMSALMLMSEGEPSAEGAN